LQDHENPNPIALKCAPWNKGKLIGAKPMLRPKHVLQGRHPIELTATRLLRLSKDLPHDWQGQHRFLGFAV
jgi:hypothetical protein